MKKQMRNTRDCPLCSDPNYGNNSITDWQGNNYTRCKRCKCWYQNPIVDFEYEENYWGIIKDPDGNIRDLRTEKESKIRNWYCGSIPYVNSLAPGKILDIGAGLGFFLSAVNDRWEKHAMDVSKKALGFIKESQPGVMLHQGIVEKNSFKESYFDVIMFYHVIEHLEDPGKVLTDLGRFLKPGGILIIGTPNIGSVAAKWFKGNFRLLGNGHLVLFNHRNLCRLIKESGLEIITTEYPFWGTDYANMDNIIRFFKRKGISPAFWGSVMTVYARKPI